MFYTLLGSCASRHKHVVGVVQQIAICTWPGPGELVEREGGRGIEGWNERKKECLIALEY